MAQAAQGFVILAGTDGVTNEGLIRVPNGSIQMTAGSAFKLTLPSATNRFLNLELTGTASTPGARVRSAGGIQGAHVELKLRQGSLNQEGIIEAVSLADITDPKNGAIDIRADRGEILMTNSTLTALGDIQVTGSHAKIAIAQSTMSSDKNLSISSQRGMLGVAIQDAQLSAVNIDIVGSGRDDIGTQMSNSQAHARDALTVQGYSALSTGADIAENTLIANNVTIMGSSMSGEGVIFASAVSAHTLNLHGESIGLQGVVVNGVDLPENQTGAFSVSGNSFYGDGVALTRLPTAAAWTTQATASAVTPVVSVLAPLQERPPPR